ncbi:MAG TPA: M15 family metallopeptidase [Actinophytocola sp.]|nr:M15 family metallopeptidase [Actinophytocola sp.]HEV2782695.1 M15 family metallopeptidase [Actinophytocola sp.]
MACSAAPPPPDVPVPPPPTTTTASTEPTTTTTPAPAPAPAWRVGASPLPRRPDGFGEVLPTPPELVRRSLPTVDRLPPPEDGRYAATAAPVPADVLARSTWQPSCPVAAADLRYLTMPFWGFDGRPHTGEMIVDARVADGVTKVFGSLYAARFPIEEMRVTSRPELDAPPTGDGNNTTAFVCRPAVGQTRWSAHAYGLAIDLNPFCNPYVRGNLVLPELASSYVDRRDVRPGMVFPGDGTVRAFAGIGWSWGGNWRSPLDLQHFTATGN